MVLLRNQLKSEANEGSNYGQRPHSAISIHRTKKNQDRATDCEGTFTENWQWDRRNFVLVQHTMNETILLAFISNVLQSEASVTIRPGYVIFLDPDEISKE